MTMQELLDSLRGSEIAVVGMAARLPGARNVQAYWQNLQAGVEARTTFTDEQLRAEGVSEATLRNPNYVKSGMMLDDMEMFDASFFGFSPRDAAIMDPQHRQLIEVAWEAMEHAGYDPQRFGGAIGVFAGSGMNAYMPYNLFTNPDLMESLGLFFVRHTGNDKDFLATRISYLLNLRGPSVNVQTACSTSLVAIHLASQSLINYECDMALAGGVTIELPHRRGYTYQDGEILSPDGHCRAFDADSQGTVFGSGAGMVVLKRLADALQDGDTIHAVVRGSAVNNDGAGKANYFAPSVDGQAAAITEALAVADVTADTIAYVEAHGTGTPLGDPIEVAALTRAFRATTERKGYCAIGSVKANIGHLDTAAGVASFIKVVEALKHKQMPPSINYSAPNPAIDFANSPFFVNDKLLPWQATAHPRRAGVSSLGVGGTNAHLIVEEAPQLEPARAETKAAQGWQMLPLSARTPAALDAMTENLAEALARDPQLNLADVAGTLQEGRATFAHRRVVAAQSLADASAQLTAKDHNCRATGQSSGRDLRIAFMFPGGGAQYPNMGRDLYESEPLYRAAVDECLALIQPRLPFDLRALMYPARGVSAADLTDATAALEKPLAGLVALFITEYATARLWLAWGIEPAAMTGHSMGEYVAATLAGVFTLKDALAVVALRGELFASLPGGGMLSIPQPAAEVEPLLVEGVSIAVINGPASCVVSGATDAINAMAAVLTAHDMLFQQVRIDVAAHSPMLDPILETFHAHLATLRLNPPTIPYISNVTGTWVRAEDATDPRYWTNHLRQTVRFGDGIGELLRAGDYALLEVGPGSTLGSLAREHPARSSQQVIIPSLRHRREQVDDVAFAYMALGRLWLAGYAVDWQPLRQELPCRRIPLPTYPFERQRHWIEPGTVNHARAAAPQDALAHLDNLDDWFYQPVWKHRPHQAAPAPAATKERWLIFMDSLGVGKGLVKALEELGHEVITVHKERMYDRTGPRSFQIVHDMRMHYFDLISELAEERLPDKVVHLWGVTPLKHGYPDRRTFYEKQREALFYSLLYLAQALGSQSLATPVEVSVISTGMQEVHDEGVPHPEKALLLGPCRVAPREHPELRFRSIDIPFPATSMALGLFAKPSTLDADLLAELLQPVDEPVLALRADGRWVQEYEKTTIAPAPNRLREGGVYLITGGLGDIGMTLAQHLATTVRASLILISRSALPPRTQWQEWCVTHPDSNRTSQRIRTIQQMEAQGAQVMLAVADFNDLQQMRDVVAAARARFGAIDGVFHAAGVLDDGLLQQKSGASIERVLTPKVRGAILLDELLADAPPAFNILFSSTSALLGPAGQIDYVAANAYLDAYAQASRSKSTYTVAVAWGMWQQIGMAARAAQEQGTQSRTDLTRARAGNHPWLTHFLPARESRSKARAGVFLSQLSVDEHWVLDQHRLKDGRAVMPGTGYLELARAAIQNGSTGALELTNMDFLAPLVVGDKEARETRVTVNRTAQGSAITIASRGSHDAEWLEHARASAHLLDEDTTSSNNQHAPYPLDAIRARCTRQNITFAPGEQHTRQEDHLQFGKRWKVLREIHLGADEALARLALPAAYQGDLNTYLLHPALMDLATGFGLPLAEGYEDDNHLYVPVAYGKLAFHAPLSQEIYSHVRYKGAQHETVRFDVTITNACGEVLVTVEDFRMKRITNAQAFGSSARQHTDAAAPQTPTMLSIGATEGIHPAEGMAALDRILAGKAASRLVVTSLPLPALQDFLDQSLAPRSQQQFSRPDLANEYVAPRNDLEQKLVTLWQNALGIEPLGVEDDFFALGGQSLIAIRLITEMRKELKIDLPVSVFFEAPTIAQTAALLQPSSANHAHAPQRKKTARNKASALVPIQPDGSRLPFFCVHGAGGNVMIFSALAQYLGNDQPFYGLQQQGVDGRTKPLNRIEEMAALYINEIRSVRPHGPYLLGGFSVGGEIAFEMAQQLTAQGEEVRLLVLFDTLNPVRAIRGAPLASQNGAQGAPAHASGAPAQPPGKATVVARKIKGHVDKLAQMSLREQAAYLGNDVRVRRERVQLAFVIWNAQRRGKTLPFEVVEQQLWEISLEASRNYVPQVYSGKITLFRSSELLESNPLDDPMGWQPLAAGGVEQYLIEGTHRLIDEPFVVDVVKHLEAILDEVQ